MTDPARDASRAADILAAELNRNAFGNATPADVEAAWLRVNEAMREWRRGK